MTFLEVLKIAEKDSDIKFTRKFWVEHAFNDNYIYRVNIKGRINLYHTYEPYKSYSFLAEHMLKDDWIIVG